jgi:hypothetical protein
MGNKYWLLCNPYPIFPDHFTIASRYHVAQSIRQRFDDLLKISRCLSRFTCFYNGPESGASAPDHMHFQAVSHGYMPIDHETEGYKGEEILNESGAKLYPLTRYLRNGFRIEAETEAGAAVVFKRLYHTLRYCVNGESEPRMNLFCRYDNGRWEVVIVPRIKHRPWQFYADGSQHILTSPGAADIGGVFITPRKEDFEKINPTILRDIFTQLCFDDSFIRYFTQYLYNH